MTDAPTPPAAGSPPATTDILDDPVPGIIESFADLDDPGLAKLLEDEKAGANRVTLTDAIEVEQRKRQVAADEKAQEEGFTDAAAKAAAEEGAKAKVAKAKPKRRTKRKAAAENGFDKPAQDAERAELIEAANQGVPVFVALGSDTGPDKQLPPVKARLRRKRQLAVTCEKVGFATGKLSGARRFTHYFLTDEKGKQAGCRRELAAPLYVEPGEGVSFSPGALAF
jgi:hypothetical protein